MKKGTLSTAKAEKYPDNLPRREKYWGEINQKQKIERTREVVRRLQWQLEELRRGMERLNEHTHDEKGEAVVIEKIRRGYGGEEIGVRVRDRKEDEVYF